jgi:hypothetical protein
MRNDEMLMTLFMFLTRQNNPLYLKTYGNDIGQNQFFHFVVHASLDVIEEKGIVRFSDSLLMR